MDTITNKPIFSSNKNDLFLFNYSSFHCYNPILGYGLEHLPKNKIRFTKKQNLSNNHSLIYASAFDEKNNELNFFNPVCYQFPEENACKKGDLFKVKEKGKLKKFLNYKIFLSLQYLSFQPIQFLHVYKVLEQLPILCWHSGDLK